MARQLKVFSTPAGIVNAIVAAPSQKAALEAWGVRDNLFASEAAIVGIDPKLIARAMATPGEIVRAPISTDAGFLAAAKPPLVGKPQPPPGTAMAATTQALAAGRRVARTKPPPDRSAFTTAEKALSQAKEERKGAGRLG